MVVMVGGGGLVVAVGVEAMMLVTGFRPPWH